jgi:hypothetical protein
MKLEELIEFITDMIAVILGISFYIFMIFTFIDAVDVLFLGNKNLSSFFFDVAMSIFLTLLLIYTELRLARENQIRTTEAILESISAEMERKKKEKEENRLVI